MFNCTLGGPKKQISPMETASDCIYSRPTKRTIVSQYRNAAATEVTSAGISMSGVPGELQLY